MNINRKLDFRLVPATGIAAGKGYRADIGNVLSLPRAHPRGSFVFQFINSLWNKITVRKLSA